ncbi:hypothetical protein AB0L63_19780 [Nocardia sp. NPDC051990]|uniref:hypothetical protein n=1 Tax=Nocardia sp. NPDC051990 TaxID=3155285 RepID=UPI00342EDCBE
MDLQLSGRTAVVTGASRGIGLAIAALTGEGMRVVAAARTLTPELENLGGDRDPSGPGGGRRTGAAGRGGAGGAG